MIKFKKNILLAPYTTYKIGGPAKYFFVAKKQEEITEALKIAAREKLKFIILGGGSNILFPDEGYNGLVIKIALNKINLESKNLIYAEAGVKLITLINTTLKYGLVGLENLAGIHGDVGGAIRGNAGAFGYEIKDFLKKIEVIRNNVTRKIDINKAKFKYRDSIFKHNKDIILAGTFKLNNGSIKKARALMKERLDYRKKNHPHLPSAGSVFKNTKKYNTRELIEKVGLKGYRINDAKISEKHTNFIVNLGNAKSKDIKKLINIIKKRVKEKFKINLKEEIVIVE